MFSFPFSADVWGTVSDWVMIIVTSITAVFLYRTLKSQKKVQETQNRLLEIEQLRVRETYKPNLKYSRVDSGAKLSDASKSIVSIAVRNFSESPALNFDSGHEDNADVTQIFFMPTPRTLKLGEGYATLHFAVNSEQGKNLNCEISFNVEYDDVAGTRYSQRIYFDAFAGGEEFRTYDPKVIKELNL